MSHQPAKAEDPVSVEQTTCLICGSSAPDTAIASGLDYEYQTSNRTFSFVECPNCSHVYLNPRPTAESANVIYPPNYYTLVDTHRRSLLGPIKDLVTKARLKDFLSGLSQGAALLEVGCGDGSLLIVICKARPDLKMTALDLQFTERHRASLEAAQIECMECLFEDAQFERSFDLIVMNQLIEHLWDVRRCLAKVQSCLAPGGTLSVSTPNLNGWDRRFFTKGTWGGYYFPRHLNLFTPESLTALLSEYELEQPETRSLVAPLIWIASLHNALKKKGSRLQRFFFDSNLAALSVLTAIDIVVRLFGASTSNMQIIVKQRKAAIRTLRKGPSSGL